MQSTVIRPVTSTDIPVIAHWIPAIPLWQRYQLTPEKTQTMLMRALERSDLLLTADIDQENGHACGLAWCLLNGAFGRSTYLRLLGVRDGFTHFGIGMALLDHAEQTAARAGQDMLLLVSDFNHGAQRFYERQGYQQIGAIPGYVLPDVTELLFWKQLPKNT